MEPPDEDGKKELRVPEALRGRTWRSIHDAGRYGDDPVAAPFLEQVIAWAEWRMATYYKGGDIPSEEETWGMVRRAIDGQAAQHRAGVVSEEAEGRRHIAALAKMAEEERAARIEGEKESKSRHRQTMIAAWLAAGTGVAGLIVGVIALLSAG